MKALEADFCLFGGWQLTVKRLNSVPLKFISEVVTTQCFLKKSYSFVFGCAGSSLLHVDFL